MTRTTTIALWTLLICLMGCHRMYEIRGDIVVAGSGLQKSHLPSVLCQGRGGPLESSGIYGRPVSRNERNATIFCVAQSADYVFPLRESIYYGSIPRRPHVYAWLAPVPAAVDVCKGAAGPSVEVDIKELDRLMSPDDAAKPFHERAPVTWPCGEKPAREMPMDFAVTFDPDRKTWTDKGGGTWIEQRTLRIK
jgi:hypothetical protein